MNVERCFDALIFFEIPWTAIKMQKMEKKKSLILQTLIKSNCIDGINVNVVSNSHPPYKKFHGILIFFNQRFTEKINQI